VRALDGATTIRATMPDRAPLWRCPECGHELVGRNMSHSCGVYDLDHHFAGKPAAVRALFDRLVARARRLGPFKVESQKTRIVFQVRVRFVAVMPRRHGLRGHLWLTRPAPGAPVVRIERLLPGCSLHHFLVQREDQIEALLPRLREAYAVGEQRHLDGRPRGTRRRPKDA
jgi:Domain of unknown function (DUF5655)